MKETLKKGEMHLPEKAKKKKIHIIQKESALTAIYASGNLTAAQKKIFNALLYLGKESLNTQGADISKGVSVPVSMLKSLISDTSTNYTYLKKTVESLQDFTVESNVLGKDKDKDGRWDRFSLVAGATIQKGILTFSFPHQIVEALQNPQMYVTLDLEEINRIDRKYAISLYEIIEDYKNIKNLPKWNLEEFRRALDIPQSTYKSFRDLRRRVIDPAVKEINDKFGMGVEYILYSNLLQIHSRELENKESSGVLGKRKRMPKITHIQFKIVREQMEKRLSYKRFIEETRNRCAPNVEEGIYPEIDVIEDRIYKVDTHGRLYYLQLDDEENLQVVELTPQESDLHWKQLWKRHLEREMIKREQEKRQ
jgi:hypothetical protein